MLLVFPIDKESSACIAWGRVRGDFHRPDLSPLTVTSFKNGYRKYVFSVNVSAKKTGHGENAQWTNETAGVILWQRGSNTNENKLLEVIKLLRGGDSVLIYGRYGAKEQKIGGPHEIMADAVIPASWLYEILLTFFADIIAKKGPPRVKGNKPETGQTPQTPQVTHPTVMSEKDGWFD